MRVFLCQQIEVKDGHLPRFFRVAVTLSSQGLIVSRNLRSRVLLPFWEKPYFNIAAAVLSHEMWQNVEKCQIITKFGREKISKNYDFEKPLLNFSKILFWFNFLLLLLANTTTILTLLLTTLNIFQIPLIKHTIHKIQILNRNKRKYFIPISTVLKSISHLFSKNSSDLQKNVSQTRRNSSNRQITHLLSKEER